MMSFPSTLNASNSSSLSPSSSSSSFPIFVKVPSGSSLLLQIDRSDTLASLFARMEDRLEWTMIPAFARLQTLDGRTLVSMGSLWQQGVAYDSTLELLFPVLGGAPTRQDDSESDQDDDLPRRSSILPSSLPPFRATMCSRDTNLLNISSRLSSSAEQEAQVERLSLSGIIIKQRQGGRQPTFITSSTTTTSSSSNSASTST
ncbi:hypothetical protein BDY24DRAFT_177308 [Mrakia frigida]|uniref:uncharacterized protein n=1 Tax=Mrakia frigida TaxID=29902 RepID=UPI003FCBF8D9